MKSSNLRMAFVTAPDADTARRLGKLVLEARLAACVNLIPAIESHYWWQGKLDSSSEILMLIKTTEAKIG